MRITDRLAGLIRRRIDTELDATGIEALADLASKYRAAEFEDDQQRTQSFERLLEVLRADKGEAEGSLGMYDGENERGKKLLVVVGSGLESEEIDTLVIDALSTGLITTVHPDSILKLYARHQQGEKIQGGYTQELHYNFPVSLDPSLSIPSSGEERVLFQA